MLKRFLYLNCCWCEFESFCGRNHLWAHNQVDVYCVLASSKHWNFCLLLLILKTAVDKNFQSFCVKTICKPIITLVLVGWWRHQNKKVSVCFKFFLLLDKPLMTWIFEVFVEGAVCEPMITLTLMTSAYTIRKFSFVGVLISPLDMINSLWLKLRANEKSRCFLIRDDAIKIQEFFYFLDSSFFLFCLRKYWLLKFNTSFGRTIITLKSIHEKGTRSSIGFLKVWFLLLIW